MTRGLRGTTRHTYVGCTPSVDSGKMVTELATEASVQKRLSRGTSSSWNAALLLMTQPNGNWPGVIEQRCTNAWLPLHLISF